ncbi:hypothetical protein [Modestobacter sp. Leaf380]|uniref:hypothetical protein n=1 Tax=Modestobacter sp. Leaf380 TaxID=1736356 RepID=UPI0006F2239E|nr:hypothetical protein [Modestobacter sp. Leaf380]KQS68901.1 hypothetical protein ASG41_08365 [Modestobacter sp. Leaf380]
MTTEQPATWDQILDDPVGYGHSEADAERIRGERTIGQVATLLHGRGQDSAAALMLDVQALTYQYRSSGGWGDSDEEIVAVLDVESYLLPRFTEERTSEIKSALDVIRDHESAAEVDYIRIREVLPTVGEGWREALMRDLAAEQPNNQARKVRLEPGRIAEDGLFLTNNEEHRVYAVLRDIQRDLTPGDTILIAPLPGARTRDMTLTPDFLIAYRGRVGVIEVDGPKHHGRFGADAQRDRLLQNAGVRLVAHILVEDLRSRESVETLVRDFLRRLIAP